MFTQEDFKQQRSHEAAKLQHVSINQFIMLMVAEKNKQGSKKKFLSVLKNAPNIEPEKEDKL